MSPMAGVTRQAVDMRAHSGMLGMQLQLGLAAGGGLEESQFASQCPVEEVKLDIRAGTCCDTADRRLAERSEVVVVVVVEQLLWRRRLV